MNCESRWLRWRSKSCAKVNNVGCVGLTVEDKAPQIADCYHKYASLWEEMSSQRRWHWVSTCWSLRWNIRLSTQSIYGFMMLLSPATNIKLKNHRLQQSYLWTINWWAIESGSIKLGSITNNRVTTMLIRFYFALVFVLTDNFESIVWPDNDINKLQQRRWNFQS